MQQPSAANRVAIVDVTFIVASSAGALVVGSLLSVVGTLLCFRLSMECQPLSVDPLDGTSRLAWASIALGFVLTLPVLVYQAVGQAVPTLPSAGRRRLWASFCLSCPWPSPSVPTLP